MVEWTSGSIRYEADQRHAYIIIRELGLKGSSSSVATPGVNETDQESFEPWNVKSSTKLRTLAARANYLAQDRYDIQFAVKELCRSMSSPTERFWARLKRLAKYLVGKPRAVHLFEYQGNVEEVTVWADIDYAGCSTTRKSTSGGVAMLG